MSTTAQQPRVGQRVLRGLLLAAAALACAGALSVMLPAGWADYQTMKTRWQLTQWTSGKAPAPGIVEWGNAINRINHGLRITPNDPNLHEGLAWLYASRAQASAAFPELAVPYMQQALASYQTAASLRPMSGTTWAHIALAHHNLAVAGSGGPPELWQAFDKAITYGQREAAVQNVLAHIAFTRWAHLPEGTRSTFQTLLANVPAHNQAAIKAIAQQHNSSHLLP